MSEVHLTAFMKVDVRGSTQLFHTFAEDQLREFLDEQKTLVTKLVTQHQGQVIKGEGDAFWVVFASVTTATQAALRIHEELRTRQLGIPDERRLALRVVIAAGDVLQGEVRCHLGAHHSSSVVYLRFLSIDPDVILAADLPYVARG